jgi:hypothetical protein
MSETESMESKATGKGSYILSEMTFGEETTEKSGDVSTWWASTWNNGGANPVSSKFAIRVLGLKLMKSSATIKDLTRYNPLNWTFRSETLPAHIPSCYPLYPLRKQ